MPKRSKTTLTKKAIDQAVAGTCVWDCQVPGFGVRAYPSGIKSFFIQYRSRAGRQGKVIIGRFPSMTVDEARKEARQLRNEVDRGGDPARGRKEERDATTVKDAMDYYTGTYAQASGMKRQTADSMRSLMERFVVPAIGSRKVADIEIRDIRAIHGRVRDKVSRYRANYLLAGLSRMFNLAEENRQRIGNPCRGVEKFEEDRRETHLTKDQISRLLAACAEHDDQDVANAIRMLLFTGARLREVLNAPWVQFDLEAGVWVKPSNHTKTKKQHRVQLSGVVIQMLRSMRKASMSQWVFPGRSLDAHRIDLKRPWRIICNRAGLEGFRIHDLRRTYASFMLSGGASLDAVGQALGHTQLSTTQRYAFLAPDVQRDAANKAMAAMGLMRAV